MIRCALSLTSSVPPGLALLLARRCHANTGNRSEEEHAFQPQQRVAGIVADVMEAEPSVALSPTPAKVGRHQGRKRLSGVQQEIIALYRSFMKEVRKFEDKESRQNATKRIRDEFKEGAKIPRKLLAKVEWQMHYARNKLEDLKAMRPSSRFRTVA